MSGNQHKGFNLIEMMVVVAIIGIATSVATPTMQKWISNNQIRGVAEALQNGIRLAQSEAVRRGMRVQFVLTDNAPVATNVSASNTGKNWVIQTMNRVNPTVPVDFIQGANLTDASGVSKVTADYATVTFNSVGRLVSPTQLTNYRVENRSGNRPLLVRITPGGKVRMCDPAKSVVNSPDGC